MRTGEEDKEADVNYHTTSEGNHSPQRSVWDTPQKYPTECKPVQLLWKTTWRFLKKKKTELPHNLAIPFLDLYLDETII